MANQLLHIISEIGINNSRDNYFRNYLRELNLLNNKHIPAIYMYNSKEIRLALLAGLIDSDGYYDHSNIYEITQKNKRLSDDILYLCRSLGFACYQRPVEKNMH